MEQQDHLKDTINLHERMASVETSLCSISSKLDKIMDNHLPHIQSAIDGVQINFRSEIDDITKRLEKAELNWAKIIGGGAVILFIVDFVVNYITKYIK